MLPLSDPEMYDDDDEEDDEDWTYEYEDEEEPGPDIEPDTDFTVELPGTSKQPEKGEVKEKKAATPPDQLHYGDDEYASDDGSYSYVTESYSSSSFEEIDGEVRADVVLDIGKGAEKEKDNKQESIPQHPKKIAATAEKNKTPPSGEKDGPKVKNEPPTQPEPSKEGAKKKGSTEDVGKAKEDGKKEQAEIKKGTKAPPVPPPKPTLKHDERSERSVTMKSDEKKASATAKAPPAVPPKVETKVDKTSNQLQKKTAPATLPKPLSSGTKASATTGEKVQKAVPVSISKKAEIGKETTQNATPTKPPKVEAKGAEAAKVASVPPKAPTPLPPRTQPAKSQPPMEIKGSQPFSLPSYQPPPPPRLSRPPMRTRDQPLAKGLWEERTKSIPPPMVSNRQFQMARTQSASPTKQMFQSGGGAGGDGSGMSTLPTKAIFADRMRAFVQAERAAGITYPTLAISAIKPKLKAPLPAPPSQVNLKPVSKKKVPEEEAKPVVDTSKSDALARAFLARAKKLAAEMEGRESSPPPPRPLSAPSSSFRKMQQPPKPEPKPDVYKEVAPRVEKPLVKPPQPTEEPTHQKAKTTLVEKKAAAAKVTDKAAPAKKEIQKAKKDKVPKSGEEKAEVADKKFPAKKGEAENAKPGEKKKPEKKEESAKPTADEDEKKGKSKPESEQVADSTKEAKPEKEEVAAEDEEMTKVTAEEEGEGLDEEEYTEVDEEEYTEVDEEAEYTEVDEEVDEENEFTEIDEEAYEEEELADVKECEGEPLEEELGVEKEDEEGEENQEGLDEEEEAEGKKEEPKKRSRRKKGKKGRKGKKRKKQKSEADEGRAEPPEPPPKRRWIPPPRTPPEPVLMPPVEKSLCEILKEELRDGITPVKRYAKKVHSEIYLPMVIPWENEAAMQTQAGMGAFGQFRDPRIRIEDGKFGQLVEGSLKSETLLPLFEHNSKNFASQKDQYITSFGAHRRNVENIVDHHEYESEPKVKLSECVISRVFLPAYATQSDMTAFGTNRSQTTKVKYLEGMKPGCDVDSHTFISRQFKANSNENAGSHVMDRRRQVIQLVEVDGPKRGEFEKRPTIAVLESVQGVGEMKHHPITECIVPRLFCNDEIYKKTGSDFGAFRPLLSEVIGGYRMDYDDERLCKLVIPYQTAPSLTS